jgi:hypothetical protein
MGAAQREDDSSEPADPPATGPPPPPEDVIAEALRLVQPILETAGYPRALLGAPRTVGDWVVKIPLRGMVQASAVPDVGPGEAHEYTGFHGTDCIGLCGVLQLRKLRALDPPRGWGLLFFRAGPAGRAPQQATHLRQVWSSSFGEQGLAVEGRYIGKYHEAIRYGGHAAEAEASSRGLVTRYGDRKGVRWTMPCQYTTVMAMYINVDKARRCDFRGELRDCMAFADLFIKNEPSFDDVFKFTRINWFL